MFDPYALGALQPDHHDRLVADLENFARDAGIQPHWIATPLGEEVSQREVEYLKAFKRHCVEGDVAGLCYSSKAGLVSIDQRMSLLAGCLVRNFVRARVMTLGDVLDHLHAKSMPDLQCILIPNFFLSAAEGGTIASWQVSALYDFLVSRHVQGQQTIIYASDPGLMAKEYGVAFGRFVGENYKMIGG